MARKNNIRVFLLVAASGLAISMLAMPARLFCQADRAGDLSPNERRGKQIYSKGDGGERGEIKARLGNTEVEMPATSFPCANCHGLRGEGSREGGLQPPPLTWITLTAPARSALTDRQRLAYDETTLARAIRFGLDPAGRQMHPGMPQYRLGPEQMNDLLAYLKKLGTEADAEPGVNDAAIKVGAALPLTGPLAGIGADVKATLAAYFAEVNARGGIFGRRFELVTADSRGEAVGALDATRQLVEREEVFALIASAITPDSDATQEWLRRAEVPLIGPLTPTPRLLAAPNPYVFYLVPTLAGQASSLLEFISPPAPRHGAATRLAILSTAGTFDDESMNSLRAQAKSRGVEIASQQNYRGEDRPPLELPDASQPDYVLFFGGAEDFVALAREIERRHWRSELLSSAALIGRAAFTLPPDVARRTYLSSPVSPSNQAEFSEFLALVRKTGADSRNAALPAIAFAAAKTLVEGTKLSGRQLTRAALINALERLRDFQTGVIPPISFTPNRRVGVTGSYIVGIDPDNQRFVELREHPTPKR